MTTTMAKSSLLTVDPQQLVRLSRPGPRYTSYPTAPEWTDHVGPHQLEQRLQSADQDQEQPLSLYIHLPFCRNMCTYCGCNVVVARRQDRADLYLDHVLQEMDLVCTRLPHRRLVGQLHLGGGTPTFLDEAQLLRLWAGITERFQIMEGAEVALEIDPVVTSTEQLALLRGMGFNRVSMGVQDFTPEVQEIIGRRQTVEQTRRLYDYARALGYRGINFDLIYGLPGQAPETFTQTLKTVLQMGPDRVAVFSYAHVPWMRPHQRKFAESSLLPPEEKFRLFALAHHYFTEAGYVQIGMDHFARPEDELSQARRARLLHRNFQGYTVVPSSDILAFGITGISDVQGCYAQNLKTLPKYYRAVEQGRLPVERGCVLTEEDKLRREVIYGIMCNFHVDLGQICVARGLDPRQTFSRELEALGPVVDAGLATQEDLRLTLTPLGRVLSRNVAMVFDTYLARRKGREQTFSKTI